MVSLTTLILSQSKEGIIDKVALHDLYQELSSLKQLGPSPASLELSLYGENETRIILASICLQRLKKIRLYGYHLSETSSNLQSCYLLKNLVPADFLNSIRHISFGLSFGQEVGFDVIGSASDALPLTEDDFMLELSECSDSLFIPEQSLQALRILEEALTLTGVLAPNASALRISHLSCNRLHDGTWPAMRVLQSFPRIQILGIEAGMAFREFLPSSGLSYLWKFPSQTVWQIKNSSWRWPIPELVQRRGALAIGTIDTVNMLNGVHPDEYSEEDTDSDPVEYDGFIVADKEEFSGSEHGALHELVSSLVPNLQVIQFITPEYDFGVPKFWAVDLIENCLYFRKAIGLPIAQVLLTYHRAPKWGFKLAKTGSEIMAVEDGELWPWNSERYISGSEHSESELSD
ncbi:hypothetical protein AX16_005813 [Volvariella volvacea WC 439]|nr:hypothetical protein AX16_005813 [Volvariella volvacea WC 439]